MLILAAVVAIFVYGMTAAMLGTILPGLSDRFKLTPSQNGKIALAQALGLTLASLAVGPLIDARGDKTALLLGLILIALPVFLLPRASGFGGIVILLFVLGAGGGIVVTGANVLANGAVTAANRVMVANLVNLFFGLGGFATPFLSANLLKKNSTRLCYTIATFAVITLAVHSFAPMPPPSGGGFVLAQVGPILGKPLLFLLSALLFLYISCECGVWNWLPRHLIAQGVPESRALNILSFGFALGLLFGRLGTSAILRFLTPLHVLLAASIAMAVTTFLVLQTRKPSQAWALVFIAGLSMAPVFPTILGITGTAFPDLAGTALGFVMTCGWSGLAVSSPIIGAIAGGDPRRLRKALLLIPGAAVLMCGLVVAISSTMR